MYGFSPLAVALIKSYLADRVQSVYFNNTFSNFKSVQNGVPQGSILGPLLFIIYINDLSFNMNTESLNCYLYADDVCLTLNSPIGLDTDISALYNSKILTDWCCSNNLSLNINKTQELNIHYGHNQAPLASEPVKFLGIVIQNDMEWHSHIRYLIPKINKGVFIIRKLSYMVSTEILLSVYFGFIHSHLTYGTIIWANSSYTNCLFVAQKKAIRLICKVPCRKSCRELFVKLRVMPLPCIYIYQCLLFIKYNISNFKTNADIHNYGTRHCTDIKKDFCQYSKSLNSFRCLSIKLYNRLPLSIRSLSNIAFKTVVKDLLIRNSFYNIDEYINHNFVYFFSV